MDTKENVICCGCLSTDRKMLPITELTKKQYFLEIIREFNILQNEEQTVYLCWECKALVDKFIKFKQQVKLTYCIFKNFHKEKFYSTKLKSHSKLSSHKLENIVIDPNTTETYDLMDIDLKIENEVTQEIDFKEEINTYTDNSEDDQPLVDIKERKRNRVNGKVKKRKKQFKVYIELELTEEEVREERRLLELKEEYDNAMFRCEKCIESFPNEHDMKDHFKTKHEMHESNLKCKICECSFNSDVSFNYHKNKHIRRYQCTICNVRSPTKSGAVKHYTNTHCTDLEYGVLQKPEQNGRSEQAEESDSTRHQSVSFPCQFCSKVFRWKASLRKHMETHRIQSGQKRKPYCEPCRLYFTTSSNLRKHVQRSSKHQIQLILRKQKDANSEESANPEKIRDSIEKIKCTVNKAKEQYACQQCDKRFQWRGNLVRHLHSHQGAHKDFVCEPCNRTFASIATYKQHFKISKRHVTENEFKYMCSDCGKRFANKIGLQDHINWEHLKNYVHTCPVCQKVFKTHTSLYLHKQVVHMNGQSQHLCDHCGKSFPNYGKFRSHVRAIHNPESPYKCATCSARFRWHSCLSRHIKRVHKNSGSASSTVRPLKECVPECV